MGMQQLTRNDSARLSSVPYPLGYAVLFKRTVGRLEPNFSTKGIRCCSFSIDPLRSRIRRRLWGGVRMRTAFSRLGLRFRWTKMDCEIVHRRFMGW